MSSAEPDVPQWKPGLLDRVRDFFRGLPAAWVVIVTVGLIALAVWLGSVWPPYFWMIHAIKTAPPAATSSSQSGLVKLSGKAQPGSEHAPSPYSGTPYVWFEAERLDTRSTTSRSTGVYSVAPVLVRDAAGDCEIDPQEAVVLPTLVDSDMQNRMFGSSTSRSEKLILPGDPVFAVGEIRRARDGAPGRACRLRPTSQGVLLVSGKTEAQALFRLRLYFWPAIGGMFLALGFAAWAFRAHVQGYPRESIVEFVDALKTRPWMRYPGSQE